MLEVSEAAAKAIEELAEGGGLRLVGVGAGDDLELEMSIAGAPEPGDEVVESGTARVFLDATAAGELADQVLDVHAHGDHVHFTFAPQDDT